jgi:Ca2+-binding EF-hand superfamily protein
MKQKVKEPESMKMLKEAYAVLDCSGDGLIPTEFLKLSIMNTGNCPIREVNQLMEILDSVNDGNIHLEDFHQIVVPHDFVTSTFNQPY